MARVTNNDRKKKVSEQKVSEKPPDNADATGSGCGLCLLTTIGLIVVSAVFTVFGYLNLKELAALSGALIVFIPLIWLFGMSMIWWSIRKITGIED